MYWNYAATALVGHWFSNERDTSIPGEFRKKYFLKIENPDEFTLEGLANDIADRSYEDWNSIQEKYEDSDYGKTRSAARNYVGRIRRYKTDGLIIDDEELKGISYVVLNSNQAKSADIITYDESGNIIPLSKRFKSWKNDIRYSITVDGRQVDHLGDVMDMAQHRRFMSEIDTKPKRKFAKAADGDVIVPVDNLLVYTDFKKSDPGISKIISVTTKDPYDIDGAFGIVQDLTKGGYDDEYVWKVLDRVYPEGTVARYDNYDFGEIERYDRQAERGKIRSDAYHAEQEQKRRGFSVDAEGNVVNEDIRRQIGIDDIETYDTTTDRVLLQNVAPILEKGA